MQELREMFEQPWSRQIAVGAISGLLGIIDGISEVVRVSGIQKEVRENNGKIDLQIIENLGRKPLIRALRYVPIAPALGIWESFSKGNPVSGDYCAKIGANVGIAYAVEIGADLGIAYGAYYIGKEISRFPLRFYEGVRLFEKQEEIKLF